MSDRSYREAADERMGEWIDENVMQPFYARRQAAEAGQIREWRARPTLRAYRPEFPMIVGSLIVLLGSLAAVQYEPLKWWFVIPLAFGLLAFGGMVAFIACDYLYRLARSGWRRRTGSVPR